MEEKNIENKESMTPEKYGETWGHNLGFAKTIELLEKGQEVTEEDLAKVGNDLLDRYTDEDKKEFKNGMIKGILAGYEAAIKEKELENNKFKKHPVATKVLAGSLAMVSLAGAIIGLNSCLNKNKKEETNTVVEQEYKSLEDLLKALDDEYQEKAFRKMNEVQKYFNNTAAPSIKIKEDKNAQLYLNAKEIVSLYVYGNADTLAKETLAKIFENSGLLDEDDLSKNFAQSGRVLNTYYRYATEKSGISDIFEDENDKELFEEFENLILSYNKNQKNETKKAIIEKLDEIYLNGAIDGLKETCPEASSFIATFIVPQLYEKQIIDEEKYTSIITINETITCNNLKENIKDAQKEAEKLNKNEIIDKVLEYMDKENIKVESRNINISAREESRYEEKDYIYSSYDKQSGSDNKQPTNRTKIGSTSSKKTTAENKAIRDKVVREFGEKAVKEAESKADVEFSKEYTDKNKQQEEYGKGLADGHAISYELTYDTYIEDGMSLSASNFRQAMDRKISNYSGSYKDSYKEGLIDGIASGIRNGLNDAKADKKKMEEAAKQPATTKVQEERYTEPTTKTETTKVQTTKAQTTAEPTTKAQTTTEPKTGIIETVEVQEERFYSDEIPAVTEPNKANMVRVR